MPLGAIYQIEANDLKGLLETPNPSSSLNNTLNEMLPLDFRLDTGRGHMFLGAILLSSDLDVSSALFGDNLLEEYEEAVLCSNSPERVKVISKDLALIDLVEFNRLSQVNYNSPADYSLWDLFVQVQKFYQRATQKGRFILTWMIP